MKERRFITDYIGIINTPYKDLAGMPVQPADAEGVFGEVTIHPEYVEGLKDLDGFSHIYLIYHLHEVKRVLLTVIPFMYMDPHGILATRSLTRPTALGWSIVRLLSVEGNHLTAEGLDMLDGTPLLDIKPYISAFDCPADASNGWMTASREEVGRRRSDHRFKERI